MGEHGEEFILAPVGIPQGVGLGGQPALGVAQHFLCPFAVGDVASGTGDGLDAALGVKGGGKDIFVGPRAGHGAGVGRFVPQHFLRGDHFLDLPLQSRRQLRRVIQLEEIPAQRFFGGLAPEIEQSAIDENEPALKIEDVIEVHGIRERRLVDAELPGRLLVRGSRIRRHAIRRACF